MTQISSKDNKLFVITRKDCTPGYQLPQSIHAVTKFIFEHPIAYQNWYHTSQYLAVLSGKDENHLIDLINKAESKGIAFSIFREPDVNNQITSIVLEPSEASRKLCSNLPLALKEFNEPNLINKHSEISI